MPIRFEPLRWLALLLCLVCLAASAQDLDSSEADQTVAVDAESLRAIIGRPVPPPGTPAREIARHFQQKEYAAARLMEPALREQVLRDWVKAAPGVDSKWVLGSFLVDETGSLAEGFALLNEVYQQKLAPPHAVRIRARLAAAHIEEHALQRAKTLLDEADEIIRKEFPLPDKGSNRYWGVRADMEYNRARSRLLWRMGKLDESLETAKRAVEKGYTLTAHEKTVEPRQRRYGRFWHVNAAVDVAVAQMSIGRLLDAEDALRNARELIRGYGLPEAQMYNFRRRIADLYFSQGRYRDSLAMAERVLETQTRAGYTADSVARVSTQTRLIAALAAMERWDEALQKLQAVDAEIAGNSRLRMIALLSDVRSLIYMHAGRPDTAVRLTLATLPWCIENFGPNHTFTAIRRGLYAAALFKRDGPGDSSQARAEFELAIRDITEPTTLSADFQESAFRRWIRDLILKSYLTMLSQSEAPTAQDAASAFVAANHLISSSVQQAIAEAAARMTIQEPALADIARLDQDAKGELSALYGYITAQGSEGQQRRNAEIVKAMRPRIAELEALRRKYRDQIQKEYPEYFQLLQPRSPSVQELASNLGPDDAFISLLSTERETYAFALDRGGQLIFHRASVDGAQLSRWVASLRKTLDVAGEGRNIPAFDFASGYALYERLLQPLEPVLQGKRHLVVATSGALGQIPFGVLPRRPWDGGSKNAESAPWLIKDFAISHIASAGAWLSVRKLSRTASADQPLLAWGDPQFDVRKVGTTSSSAATTQGANRSVRAGTPSRPDVASDLERSAVDESRYADLPPLPETRDEVLAIARMLRANADQDVVLGDKATRASVLQASQQGALQQRQVVVFATHGLLPGDLPRLEQPALAMAATSEAGASPLLTLNDVLSLKLNADWTVLSACNTAGADGRNEEALSGLARGFFYAGSRSLLVTHWSVESESAMLLTTQTFDAYKRDPTMTRAQALRTAMLAVMRNPTYAHPAFWAPYALVGEGGR